MGLLSGLSDWFTRNVANPIQDLVAWEGDTGRVDRANGKTYSDSPSHVPSPSGASGSQDQDSSQATQLESGGAQTSQTGDTTSTPVSKVETQTSGGGVASGGAGYGSSVSNVEETTTLTNQNTVSPVTEVELSNQSQSNAQGSQSQSIQSQAQKSNVYQGGGTVVAPVVTLDAADDTGGLSTWQLALILGAAVGSIWILKPKDGDDNGS